MHRNYQYTVSNNYLTNEQRDFYENNGYIIIKNNVPPCFLNEMREHFVKICNKEEATAAFIIKDVSLKETDAKGEYVISKLQDILLDDVFFRYASLKSVTNIVESIIGTDITGVQSMLINKPPDADPDISLHPLHQDLHYFPFRPIDTICASWTAMEPIIDEKNGCLYAVPGSHKLGQLFAHTYPKGRKRNPLYHGVQGFENAEKVNIVMEKGDTVFFHPLLLHGSGPNLTKGFRKAISVHYANTNSYFINTKGTTQENIATEVENISGLDVITAWKLKSRYVQGKRGTFNMHSHL